jgi:hypothetical protein
MYRKLVRTVALAAGGALFAQGMLTNDSIIRLVHSGLGEDVIVNMINSQPGQYSMSTDDVLALKKNHVSDRVLNAMISRASGGSGGGGGAAAAGPAAMLPPGTELVIHDGTPVRLRLNRNLSSADAHTGDTIDFEVLDDVSVDGTVLIAKGSTALGTITEAQGKRRMGRGGKLNVEIDSARLVNDDKIALRAVKESSGGGHTGAMTGGMVASALIIWPAAPFFLMMHGKDITIPKGTEVTAYVNGDTKVDSNRLRRR